MTAMGREQFTVGLAANGGTQPDAGGLLCSGCGLPAATAGFLLSATYRSLACSTHGPTALGTECCAT